MNAKPVEFVNCNGEPIDWKVPALQYRRGASGSNKRKPTVKNGYAAPPGTGPEGKHCADCTHKVSMGNYGGKHFIKCQLRKATWTNGEGTDILARSPACSKFQQHS
jgi:hypothetical protein